MVDLNTKKTMIYYNSISNGYKELYWNEQINKIKMIKDILNRYKNKLILDLGSGDGVLNNYINRNNILVSYDVSYNLLKLNNNKIKINGDILNMPFKEQTFDAVVSLSVIQDIENWRKALNNLKIIVKKDGEIIISVLKKSNKLEFIDKFIKTNFKIIDIIDELKDRIFILKIIY